MSVARPKRARQYVRVPFLLCLMVSASTADPMEDYGAAMSRLAERERRFWVRFDQRFFEAAKRFYEPLRRAPGRSRRKLAGDLAGIEEIYREYGDLERARGSVYLGLAISGHRKASAELVRQLAITAGHIKRAEGDLAQNDEQTWGELLQQKPGVRRHGLGVREAALTGALRRVPEARELLRRRLRRGSTTFRVGLIDSTTDAGLINPFLRSKHRRLRVAAINGLERLGRRDLLDPFRNDPDLVIRRRVRALDARPVSTRFFEIETRGTRVVFVLDGSWMLEERANDAGETWRQVLAAQLLRALARLPRGASFRLVMIGHDHGRPGGHAVFGADEAFEAEQDTIRRAVAVVEDYKAAAVNDDPHSAMLRAMRFADTDTIFLAYHGSPRATRFLAPAAMAADIARRNRFLGAEIHAIRLGDLGRDAKRTMKSIAARNGGTFAEAKG